MKNTVPFDIDVVVPWVDGFDPKWIRKKNEYIGEENKTLNGEERFRDFEIFQYFFEGMKRYMPWVRNIFVVTDNQRPKFKVDDSRVVFVDHKEFIPEEALPTFNSNTIELNCYKIKGLSERFILFNDDMIPVRPLDYSDFFSDNGLPKDFGCMSILKPSEEFSRTLLNNMIIINKNFPQKRMQLFANVLKYFNHKYGKFLVNGLFSMPWREWISWVDFHMPVPYLKSEFEEVFSQEIDILPKQNQKKFRSATDVSHWLIRYWRLTKGEFEPHDVRKIGYYTGVSKGYEQKNIQEAFQKGSKVLLVNDDLQLNNKEFEITKSGLEKCLSNIFQNIGAND